jgi:DNA polymerase I-like protein with 3'-5' exonuclease and polymerase domains
MRPVAIDTESNTTGDSPRPYQGDKCHTVSFADETGGWALRAAEAAAEVRRFAEDPEALIVMHNAPYDRSVLRANFGVEIPDERIYDTQAVDWMLDENADHRLKQIGAREFGQDAKAEQEAINALKRGTPAADIYRELRLVENAKARADREPAAVTKAKAAELSLATKKSWATFTFEDLEAYAIQDAVLTRDIYHLQQVKLHDDGYVIRDLDRERRIGAFAYRLQRTGIKVDQDRAAQELELAEFRAAELEQGFEGVNLASTPQLRELLFGKWGLAPSKQTKTGENSTDKEALERLSYDPRVRDLMEYRQLAKQISAYYLPLLGHMGTDGRLHPSFNAHRTVTGRFSCSNPNLQTIPRETTSAAIRQVFIAEPGTVLTEWDLSQIEVRCAAALSREPALLDVYARGGDVYLEMAAALDVTRQDAKVIVLACVYGIGAKSLATQLTVRTGRHWSSTEAGAVRRKFWKTYPRLDRLMQGSQKLAQRHGYVPLWKEGRRRQFDSPFLKFPRYYTALSALDQGGCAELLKDILLEAEGATSHLGRIVLTVHDSITWEHEPGAEPEISRVLQEITDAVSPWKDVIETPWEMKAWK